MRPTLLLAGLVLTSVALCGMTPPKLQRIGLRTAHTEIAFSTTDDILQQVYFGPILKNPDDAYAIAPARLRSQFTTPYASYQTAYPAFGLVENTPLEFRATHADGNLSTDLRITSIDTIPGNADGIRTLTVHLKDPAYPFEVDLVYEAFVAEDVIRCHAVVRHQEPGPVILHNTPSAALRLEAPAYWLTSTSATWGAETQLVEERLQAGTKVLENTSGIHFAFNANPAFMLSLDGPPSETTGRTIAGALAWPGPWRMAFSVDPIHRLQFSAGINPNASDYTLAPATAFETPAFIFTFSPHGKGPATRQLDRWARRFGLRDAAMDRPILLNSWEGVKFDFNEEKLLHMIDGIADLGGELFVLDDGWFGNAHPRNNASAGLGDWQVNHAKLPRGLDPLIDACAKRGLKFGIWVEPEMVNPKSDLYNAHPDWVIQQPGRQRYEHRNQLLLDLGRPEVRDFVFNSVDSLLREYPKIAYIKWDANRDIWNPGSSALPADQQSRVYTDFVRGLVEVASRLRDAHPGVILQVCASGGGRVGYGLLPYFHEFWTSDDTDAQARLFIQWGTLHWYPAEAMAAHVSASPNQQTGREIPLKFRFDVAMMGRLGLELTPDELSPVERDFARAAIADYKRIRPLVQHGDLFRLISPYEGRQLASLDYVAPDRDSAVFFAYHLDAAIDELNPPFRLAGLDPEKRYRITEINRDPKSPRTRALSTSLEKLVLGGDYLMEHGLPIQLDRQYQSLVLLLEAVPSSP